MRQLVYALRFEGQARPASNDGTVLRAATVAPSSSLTTVVGPDGLAGELNVLAGGEATFESEIAVTSATSFVESGTIAFGNGHRLRFTTVGSGYIGPGPEPGSQYGAVVWRVESGEGQLAGATGLVTSNFVVSATGEVTDHQFGVLNLP